MLVKVRLPTPLLPHHLPQLPHIPQLPAHMRVSMTDVDLTLSALPSSTTILASVVALFVLLSFVRALSIGFREHLAFVRGRKAAMALGGKGGAQVSLGQGASSVSASAGGVAATTTEKKEQQQEVAQRPTASWLWGLVKFFPPARFSPTSSSSSEKHPLALTTPWPSSQPQMQQLQQQQPKVNAHTASRRPGGPVYDRPLATLYERDVPVSMAKMIMSRHTFRRPTSRPPPARPASVQIQRRVPSPPPLTTASTSAPVTQVIPPPPPSSSASSASSAPLGSIPQSIPQPPTSPPTSPPTTSSPPTSQPQPQPTPSNSPSVLTAASALRNAAGGRKVPSIVIPQPKSPLYRPMSPPERSPSPPSGSRERSTSPPSWSGERCPSPPSAGSSRSGGSRSPSPTHSSSERSSERVEGHGRGMERRESEIV